MTDGPDPFESAVVGVIRILAPWPPEQRAKILQGADYCSRCGQQLSTTQGCNKPCLSAQPKPYQPYFDAY